MEEVPADIKLSENVNTDGLDHGNGNEETPISATPFEESEKIAIVNLYAIALGVKYGNNKQYSLWVNKMLKIAIKHFDLDAKVDIVLKEIVQCYKNCKGIEEVTDVVNGLVEVLQGGVCDGERPVDVIKATVGFSISEGCYDARSRCTMKAMAECLHLPWDKVEEFEMTLTAVLVKLLKEEQSKDEAQQNLDKRRKIKRALIIGVATVGGGALLALSAGLAAPLIGAGAVAVLGGSSAAIFTGTTGVAIITSIFGAAGAGLTGFKMNRRVGSIEQFEFGTIGERKKDLHIAIAISGWLAEKDNYSFSVTWKGMDLAKEQYCLCWEGRYLREFGSSVMSFIKNQAVNMAVKEVLTRTILSGLMSAISWPLALIQAGYVIDNPWSVCIQRSKEAGLHLAKVLLEKHQGERPTTLIGYSHGARLIYFCLEELANRKGSEGIIEDVYLIGAPIGVTSSIWESFDCVVAGTIVNCYSTSDWLLKFVYRTASIKMGDIAGLSPVDDVKLDRLVNVDVSDIISGHMDYYDPKKMRKIMIRLNLKTKDFEGCHDESNDSKSRLSGVIDTDAIKDRVGRMSMLKRTEKLPICDASKHEVQGKVVSEINKQSKS